MTLAEIEQLIRREIAAAREEGWKITDGLWVSHPDCERECCALGACLRNSYWDEENTSIFGVELAARRLGRPVHWIQSLANGFDGGNAGINDPDAYALGAKLRAEFVEGQS